MRDEKINEKFLIVCRKCGSVDVSIGAPLRGCLSVECNGCDNEYEDG